MTIPTPSETPMTSTLSKTRDHLWGHSRGRARSVTRPQDFPLLNKHSKAIVRHAFSISSDKKKQDSNKFEVCREDESAIDFIRRQREYIRDELDHEIQRLKMCSLWKKLNDDEALSEDDSLNGFIVDDDLVQKATALQQDMDAFYVQNMPLTFLSSCVDAVCRAKIQGKKLLGRWIAPYPLYSVDDGATLKLVPLMQVLTIVKNPVGIVELMMAAEPWPGQVIVPGCVHPDKVQNAVCMTFSIAQASHLTKPHTFTSSKGEMQIKELHIVPIMQEWELVLGFYGMLFGHDIEDGGEMTVKNIHFSTFGDMSFSTRMSHVEFDEVSSSYNAKLKTLLGEHSMSPRKAGPSMHSSPSEVLPLFPKLVPGNLPIDDTNVPAKCPLLKMELPDCALVVVLHMAPPELLSLMSSCR
ncbi:uncharacterized protein LAESUDRAFT_715294 [Laetiporus sulphureus 93-53]|uniref:Uncharacterized protein n=1 Tax=Laetiporus sulphureus 93-53 TaxID=1314785 RepID=A0A165DEQ8_9APHY|nr:uncharacterized protein LAESUDRAFT_715294 [Laetiporus sulphureus 93-53]KZT04724.1 hypothetical protein LAESUDRAFT_715294 [Laetiporus sulphureus 93-53]